MNTLVPERHDWMRDPALGAVMAALVDARYVGGAVRNALLGQPVTEVDIATPLTPPEVLARLHAAGLRVVETGIAHGTVTAISRGRPFEVTSLRRDVATDGRRAVVAFTTDWREDAQRRDFTMNALYAAPDGTLYDFVGGADDARAGRVRFVGEARARIREDYLRILRLFRFHAWYGKGDLDADARAAARGERAGLSHLSAERIRNEMLKLLAAHDPLPVLAIMQEDGILELLLPGVCDLARLRALAAMDDERARDAILRLAALTASDAAMATAARLKLSNAETARLADLAKPFAVPANEKQARTALYFMGAGLFADRILLAAADARAAPPRDFLELARAWPKPLFPLNGHDAIAAGLSGADIGRALAALEAAWAGSDFTLSRDALLARLKAG